VFTGADQALPSSDESSAVNGQAHILSLPYARRGSRGYDKAAVEELVDRLVRDVDHYRRQVNKLRVTADTLAREVTHRRSGLLPDYSLSAASADPLITAQVDAQRQSDEILRVAQEHARAVVTAAEQQAHSIADETGTETDDIAVLRQRVRDYQQLAASMSEYLTYLTGILTNANGTFTERLALLGTDDQPAGLHGR
jgi:cell division septum initiation protein DivIVA